MVAIKDSRDVRTLQTKIYVDGSGEMDDESNQVGLYMAMFVQKKEKQHTSNVFIL